MEEHWLWNFPSRYHPRANWRLFETRLVVWLVNMPSKTIWQEVQAIIKTWPITGKEVVAIDFMKEHLRKMLTDLDQDLEKYAMGAISAQPWVYAKTIRVFCWSCVTFFVFFFVCFCCLCLCFFIEQADFLEQCQSGAQVLPTECQAQIQSELTKCETTTDPTCSTHCGPRVLEDYPRMIQHV